MERAIVKGRLKIGHKLSICGAQLVGSRTTQTGLDDENAGKMLLLSANGCLPAAWDTRLGYHPKKYIIRSLPTIFDDGGMVTALDIIVCRKFPMLYTETLPNGKMVTRTAREEEEIRCGYGDMFDPALLIPNFNGEGRSNVSETRPSPEERRVSGYFKIRICDYCAYSKYPQEEWATLLLQNANELNHMDITEGSRYKIFFVVPYHPKNKRYPGHYFKTTRMTRWEPAVVKHESPYYVPRCITSCSDIHQQDSSLDFNIAVVIIRKLYVKIKESAILTILYIESGPPKIEQINERKLWRQELYVTDQSQAICRIDLRLPMQLSSNPKGQVIGLANVRFELYDPKYDITCLKTTDESELFTKGSPSADYMSKGIQTLKSWIQSNADSVAAVTERVQNIVQ